MSNYINFPKLCRQSHSIGVYGVANYLDNWPFHSLLSALSLVSSRSCSWLAFCDLTNYSFQNIDLTPWHLEELVHSRRWYGLIILSGTTSEAMQRIKHLTSNFYGEILTYIICIVLLNVPASSTLTSASIIICFPHKPFWSNGVIKNIRRFAGFCQPDFFGTQIAPLGCRLAFVSAIWTDVCHSVTHHYTYLCFH